MTKREKDLAEDSWRMQSIIAKLQDREYKLQQALTEQVQNANEVFIKLGKIKLAELVKSSVP